MPDGTEFGAGIYRQLRLIRRFEETVVELVNSNEIPGVTHEYMGQEAVAVGVCSALGQTDAITSTHRGHGHVIAKGGDIRFMFAELMGRQTGYNRGRGGSMHICDLGLGILGANGMIGAGAPMACGAAHSFRQRGSHQVVVCFFGESGINQGVLQETLNLAAIWSLPVIFVCENNLYAITTRIGEMTKTELYRRAAAVGMPSRWVDGMDVEEVRAAAMEAVNLARQGGGPSFLECRTYRFSGHMTAEPSLNLRYRSDDEIAMWKERDPIELWSGHLAEQGGWDAVRRSLDTDIEVQLSEAVDFARRSAWPDPSSALDYMYASPLPGIPEPGWS